jgi:hypothetical protein
VTTKLPPISCKNDVKTVHKLKPINIEEVLKKKQEEAEAVREQEVGGTSRHSPRLQHNPSHTSTSRESHAAVSIRSSYPVKGQVRILSKQGSIGESEFKSISRNAKLFTQMPNN